MARKPPATDAEFIRELERRVRRIENASTTRIGQWVLSSDPESGDLVATHPVYGRKTIGGA